MNRTLLKCVVVLACIAVVCGGLLIAAHALLPAQEITPDYVALTGIEDITKDDFETVDLAAKADALGADKKAVRAAERCTKEDEDGLYVLTVRVSFQFGTLEMMFGVRVGEGDASTDRVLGAQLMSTKASGPMFTETLNDRVYDYFKGKDPFSVDGNTIKGEVQSGATLTAGAVADAVHTACRAARAIEESIDYPMLTGIPNVTKADFKPIDLAANAEALGADKKAVRAAERCTKEDEDGVYVLTVRVSFRYGTLEMMFGVRVGEGDASTDRVLGAQLMSTKASGPMFTETLNDRVYDYFKGKDPFSVDGDTIAGEVQSGATLTAGAVADAVHTACRAARAIDGRAA